MSGAAHRGDDDIAFYAADIGETRALSAAAGSPTQFSGSSGPLAPGRYLIQAVNLSVPSAEVWIGFGKFGEAVDLAAVPGRRRIPLVPGGGLLAVETHVRKGDSDQIAAITSAGTATVYVTLVSTVSK